MNNKLSLMVNFVGVDKMSGALRNIVGLGRKGSRSLNQLRGEGRKLERQLRDVRGEISGASGNITELVRRERQLEAAVRDVNRQMDQRKRAMAIEGDRRAMLRRGEQLKGRGQENMAQGATLLAPLLLSTAAAADFSSGMVDIQQKAGLTDRATDQLAGNIIAMSSAAKQMPEDVRSGLDLLLAKGMGLDAATAAIGPAGRLATAYKVAIPDAAAAAYASVNNLKVASADTARVFDAMAAAGNEGGFEVRDMARHFPALTAQMQALGEQGVPAVADLSAALQVAMHTAGSADEAGNNVKNLLAKINAPASIRAFQKNFGVDLPAAMKKLTDEGYSSLEAIAMITREATGGDMKKLGFAFEDMQARQGIMALIQNLDEYRRIRDASMQSGGTVDAAFDQRVARDATVNWQAFKASASQMAITLGATLLPVATQAMDMIGGMASGIAAWAKENPRLAGTLTKIIAGLAVFKMGLGVAQFALGGFMGPMANVIAMVRKLGGVRNILLYFRTAALFMAKGVMRAGLMMLANPVVLAITLLVAAIGVAAYLIYSNWDTIKAAFWKGVAAVEGAWNAFKGFISAGFAWFVGLHVKFADIGKNMILVIARGIRGSAAAVWNALKGAVMGGVDRVRNFLGIKSPSRLFMQIGGHTAAGMAIGLDRGKRRVSGAAGRLAASVAAAGAATMAPAVAASPQMARPVSAAAAAGGINVTFNIQQQPGQDMDALVEDIRSKLERLFAEDARRSYGDDN